MEEEEREKKAKEEVQRMVVKSSHFNFEINETVTVEKIIRSTFANPDRGRFGKSKAGQRNFHLLPGEINPETIIERIASEIPEALK